MSQPPSSSSTSFHKDPSQTVTVKTGLVSIHPDIDRIYDSLKRTNKYRFAILKLDMESCSEIQLEQTGDRHMTWRDFVQRLPSDECRYGFIELDFYCSDDQHGLGEENNTENNAENSNSKNLHVVENGQLMSSKDKSFDIHRTALVFVIWAPSNSTIRSRMLYATCTAFLGRKFQWDYSFQANSAQDLSVYDILDKVSPDCEAILREPQAPNQFVHNLQRQCCNSRDSSGGAQQRFDDVIISFSSE